MTNFQQLELLMQASGNFKHYRATVANAKPPAVPYFGIYLRFVLACVCRSHGARHVPRVLHPPHPPPLPRHSDLTFLHQGNPDFVHGGLANITKWRKTLKIVSGVGGDAHTPASIC